MNNPLANKKSREKSWIEVYGSTGLFTIPNSKYKVRFFSSSANNKVKNSGPSELLRELKPMRERVDASVLHDITSLLQRDLNDSRVANELVPYLLGRNNTDGITFFPAILAVLIPHDFLIGEEKGKYPILEKTEDKSEKINSYSYDDKWVLEVFTDADNIPTSLGKLKIDKIATDIVVLDGQHRANAFRVVTNTFKERNDSIYEAFYENVDTEGEFDADLPVTIIWFEGDDDTLSINPTMISRKLFVDVNNTARPVSSSRSILLNDYDPTAVLTKSLYANVADSQSFNTANFSLLYSGFDVDSDLKKSNPHSLVLTTPKIIFDVIDWVFFASDKNNELDRYFVKRVPSFKTDTTICAKVLPLFRKCWSVVEDDNGNRRKIFEPRKFGLEEKKECDTILFPVFDELFNSLPLLKAHYAAGEKMEQLRNEKWNSDKKQVWDKIFCGGEGLYYSYLNLPKNHKNASQRAIDILETIKEIETEFDKERAKDIPVEPKRVKDAFRSFRTKAFQIGYFSAFFDYLYSLHANVDKKAVEETIKAFSAKINEINAESWCFILTDLRQAIVTGIDPKKWPTYHKILLRIVQNNDTFYGKGDNWKDSPEAEVFKKKLENRIEGWAESEGIDRKDVTKAQLQPLIEIWLPQLTEEVKELFDRCNIDLLKMVDFSLIVSEYIESKSKSHKLEEEDQED